jgi:hypothetical protein
MKKLITIAALAATIIASPALAAYDPGPTTGSASNQAEHARGDYPGQSQSSLRQSTVAQMKQAEEGDFYAPVATTVQQPTARELKQAREGDFYAPSN